MLEYCRGRLLRIASIPGREATAVSSVMSIRMRDWILMLGSSVKIALAKEPPRECPIAIILY